jgi:hypothetical protein
MYYVYNQKTSKIASNPTKGKRHLRAEYKTMAAAQAALTRWDKKWFNDKCNASDFDRKYYPERYEDSARPIFKYAICEAEDYHKNIERFETVYSMMDKDKKNPIRQSVNTPAYMDPSCESYWTM